MTLGEKIKEARIERKMTQKDVVGDYITRNMLSKIENGSATPSIKTLEYLANSLGLPSSYFMDDMVNADGEIGGIEGAREAYRAEDYRAALEMLDAVDLSRTHADEASLLRAKCCAGFARGFWFEGDLTQARAYAREALKHNAVGLYFDTRTELECCQILMLWSARSDGDFEEYEKRFNDTIAKNGLVERMTFIKGLKNCAERGARGAVPASLRAEDIVGDWSRAVFYYLKGMEQLELLKHDDARETLLIAEKEAEKHGDKLLRGDIYACLERVHKEKEDFKQAYHYAALRLEL